MQNCCLLQSHTKTFSKRRYTQSHGSIDSCPDLWTMSHELLHFGPVYRLNTWLKTCPNMDYRSWWWICPNLLLFIFIKGFFFFFSHNILLAAELSYTHELTFPFSFSSLPARPQTNNRNYGKSPYLTRSNPSLKNTD